MRKLFLALALLLAGSPAFGQVATWPPPAGAVAFLCVYNSSPPTLSNTNVGFAQCDSAGSLRVSASFTPSGTQDVNITQILSAAVSSTNPLFAGQSTATTTMATAAPTAATFSALLASNASRKACLIQNTGTTTGYVYFGATGSATTGNSFVLSPNQAISCTNNNVTLTDNVAGTCASSTCAFVISSQ